jgi:hypothetical protein
MSILPIALSLGAPQDRVPVNEPRIEDSWFHPISVEIIHASIIRDSAVDAEAGLQETHICNVTPRRSRSSGFRFGCSRTWSSSSLGAARGG